MKLEMLLSLFRANTPSSGLGTTAPMLSVAVGVLFVFVASSNLHGSIQSKQRIVHDFAFPGITIDLPSCYSVEPVASANAPRPSDPSAPDYEWLHLLIQQDFFAEPIDNFSVSTVTLLVFIGADGFKTIMIPNSGRLSEFSFTFIPDSPVNVILKPPQFL